MLNDTSPVSSYSVDGESPFSFTAPSNITQTQYNQAFYEQEGLSPTEHTLTINIVHASDSAPFLFDYIGYIPLREVETTSSMPNMPTGGLPTNAMDQQGSSSHSSNHIGAVVGGVVGGVALMLLTAAVVYFLCGRRRNDRPYFYESANASELLEQGKHIHHMFD
jgi:hypothetical protein